MMMKGGLHPSTQRDLRGPADEDDGEDPFKAHRDRNPANIPIAERESAYQAKGRATRELSPERQDPFADAMPRRGSGRPWVVMSWTGSATIY